MTAAFSKDSEIKHAAAFKGGQQVGKQHRDRFAGDFIASNEAGANVIYLYDGPPVNPPVYPAKMVCFTSPNEKWLSKVAMDETALNLYMPLWDSDELFAAATALGLDSLLTRAVIDDRMSKFGGVARECLSRDECFVERRLIELQGVITGMESLAELTRLVEEKAGSTTHHHLCHYVPVRGEPWKFNVQIASKFVSLRVRKKISDIEFEGRARVIRYFRGVP